MLAITTIIFIFVCEFLLLIIFPYSNDTVRKTSCNVNLFNLYLWKKAVTQLVLNSLNLRYFTTYNMFLGYSPSDHPMSQILMPGRVLWPGSYLHR